MKWIELNPLSSSGFLLVDGDGAGRDVLVDTGCPDMELERALVACGSGVDRIAYLFVTHMDCDHITGGIALMLAEGGARVCVGSDEFFRHKNRWLDEEVEWDALLATGRVELLARRGEMKLSEFGVRWATFAHGECINNAYRIGDWVFSGDTSVGSLLDGGSVETRFVLGIGNDEGGGVGTLVVNTTHLSRDEIRSREDLPRVRVENYLYNHGIAEDLVAAMDDEGLAEFFGGLERIVPHHLRKKPLTETARRIKRALEKKRDECGFNFEVVFLDCDELNEK